MIFTNGMLAALMGIDINDVVRVKFPDDKKEERLVLTKDYTLFSSKYSDHIPLRILIGLEYRITSK